MNSLKILQKRLIRVLGLILSTLVIISFHITHHNTNDFFECFTLLLAVAATTSKVKLGQVVACNSYRNPALLAKMVSTLDIISNVRVELGIGSGWHVEEYEHNGYEFPSAVARIAGYVYSNVSLHQSFKDAASKSTQGPTTLHYEYVFYIFDS